MTIKNLTPRRHIPLKDVSQEIEDLHRAFLDECHERGVQSVKAEETSCHRSLIFADGSTLRINKATGLFDFSGKNLAWMTGTLMNKQVDIAYMIGSIWGNAFMDFAKENGKVLEKRGKFSTSRTSQLDYASSLIGSRKVQYKKCQVIYTVYKFIWSFLIDRDIAKLTLDFFGRKATYEQYNLIVKNKKLCQQLSLEYPNMTGLIGKCLECKTDYLPKFGSKDILRDIKNYLVLPTIIERKFEYFHFPAFDLVKKSNKMVPLSQSGWRMLSNMSKPCVNSILDRDGKNIGKLIKEENIFIINICAEANEVPTYSHLRNLTHENYAYDFALGNSRTCLTRLIRLSIRESKTAKKRGKLKNFLSNEWDLVKDWFTRSITHGHPDIPKNSTWKSLMKHQEDWHAVIHAGDRQRVEEEDAMTWTFPIDTFHIDGYEIKPITNGKDLREEVALMQHCCGSYASRCANGHSMIFSVVNKGDSKDRATLEISHHPIRINQTRGVKNKQASKKIEQVSKKVLSVYSKSYR